MQVYGSNRQEVTKTATKPVINSATVTSKTIEQAILSINTTSSVAIAKYRVVDNANGIDWFVSSLNPTEYVIAHLKDNTSYTLSLYAYDIDGNKIHVRAREELAIAFQHELDHLNGILFVDRANKTNPKHIPDNSKPIQFKEN